MSIDLQSDRFVVAVAPQTDYTEPAWRVALLFPPQGAWSDEDYLALDTNRLVELDAGRIEVLAMPSDRHQAIVTLLLVVFAAYAQHSGGAVRTAPLPLRLSGRHYREPDILFLHAGADPRRSHTHWTGADLVVEVVSPDDPDRDLVIKRLEYAQAGIPEYWIVNPLAQEVLVLRLSGAEYVEHGRYGRGQTALAATLPDLQVAVDAVLDAP